MNSDARAVSVLIAEDEAINRLYLSSFLSERGYRTTAVKNGLEAVRISETSEFDVILMDLGMPGMGGLDAIRRIRSRKGAFRSYIIALTAHADADDLAACREVGVDDFISKPYDEHTLLAKLAAARPRKGDDGARSVGRY